MDTHSDIGAIGEVGDIGAIMKGQIKFSEEDNSWINSGKI